MDPRIAHLTRTPNRYRIAAWFDEKPVLGWVLGSVGVIWLPVVTGTVVSILLSAGVGHPHICWTAGPLLFIQVLAGLIAHGAKRRRVFSEGVQELLALQAFLDWMHKEVFSNNTSSRITVMVPVNGADGLALRSFLRPSSFPSHSSASPSLSDTELAIRCNEREVEGAAGLSFCEGTERRIRITVDPDDSEEALEEYARQSYMPLEKARRLTRKARFYFALPIESRSGPHLGVLVVDNANFPRIVDSDVKASADRAEEQVKLFAQWVALRLEAIPVRIRRRA